jgi:hypothetical protein
LQKNATESSFPQSPKEISVNVNVSGNAA